MQILHMHDDDQELSTDYRLPSPYFLRIGLILSDD